jgi:hypothetical protein
MPVTSATFSSPPVRFLRLSDEQIGKQHALGR